ncbi:MAG: response regulator [Magnetococcus sp. MYC-9]
MMGSTGRPKILLVDDSPIDLQFLIELLAVDYEVLAMTESPAILTTVATFRPDLIVLDIEMPEMDGFAVCAGLQDNPGTRRIPIIILTVRDSMEDELRGLSLGAVDYIVKPFHPDILLARIKNHLELNQLITEQQKPKLLIVDDAPNNIHMLSQILKSDYDISVATDGEKALWVVSANKPDLVLLDIEMPDMDGYEVCARLKANLSTRRIPVIFLTARDTDQDEAKGLQIGAIDYITKPFRPEVVSARVRNHVMLKQHRDAMDLMMGALKVSKESAEQANRAKGDFLATMSHEIRTPMNAIIGLTDLALEEALTPKVQDYLIKASNASRSLLRIINDILDFSKMEAGKLQLDPVDFLLRDVLDHLADLFRQKAAEQGVELIFQVGAECRYALTGDYLRLEQILMNLISNALKFTEEGEIEVGVRLLEQRHAEVTLEFFVRDTGIGLSRKQIETLFTPFVQADSSATRRHGGTGLGLSICKQLVEKMGGRIGVESTPGAGSVFRFTVQMPRREEAEQEDMVTPEDMCALRVLVVEDNPSTRRSLRAFLDSFNFVTTVAASGREALRKILQAIEEKRPYQLLLVDWLMPEWDGIETARRVLERNVQQDAPGTPPLKFILLTDYGREEEVKQRAAPLGIQAFLPKPINCSLLFDTVMEVFQRDVSKVYRPRRGVVDWTGVIERLSGARVLLVEDNAINQLVAQEVLEHAGVVVTTVGDGLAATRMVMEAPFDLVLMDIQMPVMDGFTASRQIRRQPRCKELPIIAMTAHAMEGDRQRCLEAGMNDHIAKPIDRKHLYATLMIWIKPGLRSRETTIPPSQKGEGAGEPPVPAQLPGIDVADGLDRLGNNHRLYRLILLEFKRDFDKTADTVRTALQGKRQDDLLSARDRVHAVKGIAGNMAASRLFHASRELEQAIQTHQREEWPALLDHFATALQEVVDGIATLLTLEEQKPAEEACQPAEEMAARLMALAEAIQGNETCSAKNCQSLRPLLRGEALEKMLNQVELSCENYDFPEAQRHLTLLCSALNIPLPRKT